MSARTKKSLVNAALALDEKIGSLLAGHDPTVQGATLASLTITWLNGYHPLEFRRTVFEMHVNAIRRSIEEAPDADDQ